jgi:putative NADPH-quinone reductase
MIAGRNGLDISRHPGQDEYCGPRRHGRIAFSGKLMNISIILAHPNPGSFNHAIANTAAEALLKNRHNVVLHDLYQEQFPPLLSAAELQTNARLDPVIAGHCKEIAGADGIIIVHPNWWGMPPAILKGWIDRVLRMEIAYRFVANDKGEGVPVGLLKAKAAIVFNTANTPEDREREVFGDPLESLWKKCVFDLCGVRNVHRRTFSVVITSTPAQRAAWLQEVQTIVARCFPPKK